MSESQKASRRADPCRGSAGDYRESFCEGSSRWFTIHCCLGSELYHHVGGAVQVDGIDEANEVLAEGHDQ